MNDKDNSDEGVGDNSGDVKYDDEGNIVSDWGNRGGDEGSSSGSSAPPTLP